MGDPTGYPDERPLAGTKIERPFWMGKFEVTNEQFACFDPSHRSGHEGALWLKWSKDYFLSLSQPRQPVCRVSWEEAEAFCRWLTQKTGRKCTLPSEAQWEWACRAGTDTALSYGPLGTDSAPFANLADTSLLRLSLPNRERVQAFMAVDAVDDKYTVSAPVGTYQANPGVCTTCTATWPNGRRALTCRIRSVRATRGTLPATPARRSAAAPGTAVPTWPARAAAPVTGRGSGSSTWASAWRAKGSNSCEPLAPRSGW